MKGGRKNCDKKRCTDGTVTMNQNPVPLTYDWDTERGKAIRNKATIAGGQIPFFTVLSENMSFSFCVELSSC